MKTVTVRLPEALVAEIEAESRQRNLSKSDVVRERLVNARGRGAAGAAAAIEDLIGSIDGLPPDLSEHKKSYLQASLAATAAR